MRKVLLIEPNYKNKYPPMGLMKISTYHKILGDKVKFYKGTYLDFILEEIYCEVLPKVTSNDSLAPWQEYKSIIKNYIRYGRINDLNILISLSKSKLVLENLKYYRKYFLEKKYEENPKWDRVFVTTLFTFSWNETIAAINSFKKVCKDQSQVFVGGIAASLVPDEMEKETGIRPNVGLLDKGGEYDPDNEIIIDELPLDYSILNEINYKYVDDAYFAYMTRGCVNKCSFCAVPKIEKEYKSYISIVEQIRQTDERFGPKKDLLLLDNNVLASDYFKEIIDEIKMCGFEKGTTFINPNYYLVAYHNLLQTEENYEGYINELIELYKWLYKRCGKDDKEKLFNCLHDNRLLTSDTATKERIITAHEIIAPIYAKHKSNVKRFRYVDFNQGIDARLLTEEKVKLLSEIAINPLRIAFDSWKLRNIYEKAIRLAVENGINKISNYLLYNYDDKPIELYYRLRMNVELCDELNVDIYSFPMKFHPIQDPDYFRNRNYFGEHWNKKYIRAIQAILNATKGSVGRGLSFFEAAFGQDEEEFYRLLYMPDTYIVFREFYQNEGITDRWWKEFSSLPDEKLEVAKKIIHDNSFVNIEQLTNDKEILSVLEFYRVSRDDAARAIESKKQSDMKSDN